MDQNTCKTCAHYSHSILSEEPFVTKEYLSKALLEYMLKLELLPEIQEIEDKSKKT